MLQHILLFAAIVVAVIFFFWRLYLAQRRQIEAMFLPASDDDFLVRHIHGPQREIDIYRIDRATRAKIKAALAREAAIRAPLITAVIIGAVTVQFWDQSLILTAAILLLAFGSFLGLLFRHHHVTRRVGAQMTAGTKVPYARWEDLTRQSANPDA